MFRYMKEHTQACDHTAVQYKDVIKRFQQIIAEKHIFEHTLEKNLTSVSKASVTKDSKHLAIYRNILGYILVRLCL